MTNAGETKAGIAPNVAATHRRGEVAMPGFFKPLVMILIACCFYVLSIAPIAYAAEGAPLGAWRTTNDCFLAAFVLTEDGRARAVYMTGERDDNAAWVWDGGIL